MNRRVYADFRRTGGPGVPTLCNVDPVVNERKGFLKVSQKYDVRMRLKE
jgi:hypothetical protein